MDFVPNKLYYKIGDVCRIVGVEAYVLRYWEKEFPALAPPKSKSGQRTYRPKDIELLLKIRTLLYDEGFTIAGARKKLGSVVPGPRVAARAASTPVRSKSSKAARSGGGEPLGKVREELQNILTLLDRG
jgi:DNA-binding transcriptional MerR regulator